MLFASFVKHVNCISNFTRSKRSRCRLGRGTLRKDKFRWQVFNSPGYEFSAWNALRCIEWYATIQTLIYVRRFGTGKDPFGVYILYTQAPVLWGGATKVRRTLRAALRKVSEKNGNLVLRAACFLDMEETRLWTTSMFTCSAPVLIFVLNFYIPFSSSLLRCSSCRLSIEHDLLNIVVRVRV